MALAKEQIRQIINQNDITSVMFPGLKKRFFPYMPEV